MGTKGSRLTTQLSLAGRYLVYVPQGEGLGVSRRLEDDERNRAAARRPEERHGRGRRDRPHRRRRRDARRRRARDKDLQLLLDLLQQLAKEARALRTLCGTEADLSLRIIRDLMNDEVEEVLVDDDRQYQRIMNYLKRTSPILAELHSHA